MWYHKACLNDVIIQLVLWSLSLMDWTRKAITIPLGQISDQGLHLSISRTTMTCRELLSVWVWKVLFNVKMCRNHGEVLETTVNPDLTHWYFLQWAMNKAADCYRETIFTERSLCSWYAYSRDSILSANRWFWCLMKLEIMMIERNFSREIFPFAIVKPSLNSRCS